MPLKSGHKVSIWSIENKGGYLVASLSASKKDKEGKWTGDWKNKFCWLVDKAYDNFKDFTISDGEYIEAKVGWGYDKTNDKGQSYKQAPFEISNNYDKSKGREYTNYKIYDLEPIKTNSKSAKTVDETTSSENVTEDTNPFEKKENQKPKSNNGLVGLDFLNIPDGFGTNLPFK